MEIAQGSPCLLDHAQLIMPGPIAASATMRANDMPQPSLAMSQVQHFPAHRVARARTSLKLRHRGGREADDIWPFYSLDEKQEMRSCVYCQYVLTQSLDMHLNANQ